MLSYMIMGRRRVAVVRMVCAYCNYILGKGSGAGWDMKGEIQAATEVIQRQSPCVFDVGANVGKWSEMFRMRIQQGTLLMFEPQRSCRKHIESRGIPAAELIPFAVGDYDGEIDLYVASEADATASMYPRGDSYFAQNTFVPSKVRIVTIDKVMADRHIEFVDLVKMDIEGHEVAAIRGMQNALKSRRIGAITFEFGSGNLNSRTCFKDFWNVLSDEFEIRRITPAGISIIVGEYYEDQEYFRGATNYVAVLKNHPFADPARRSKVRAVRAG